MSLRQITGWGDAYRFAGSMAWVGARVELCCAAIRREAMAWLGRRLIGANGKGKEGRRPPAWEMGKEKFAGGKV